MIQHKNGKRRGNREEVKSKEQKASADLTDLSIGSRSSPLEMFYCWGKKKDAFIQVEIRRCQSVSLLKISNSDTSECNRNDMAQTMIKIYSMNSDGDQLKRGHTKQESHTHQNEMMIDILVETISWSGHSFLRHRASKSPIWLMQTIDFGDDVKLWMWIHCFYTVSSFTSARSSRVRTKFSIHIRTRRTSKREGKQTKNIDTQ